MTERIKPDFIKWASTLMDRDDAAIALEQAYNQGYSAGVFEEGNAWWKELDSSLEQYDETTKD